MLGKFNRPAARPAEAEKPASRFAGVQATQARDPMPVCGTYRFRVVDMCEGFNQGADTYSAKATFEIVQVFEGGEDRALGAHCKIGDQVFVVFLITGKAGPSGRSRTKAMCMGCAGFDDEAEYNAFDPKGFFIDACLGRSNEYSKEGHPVIGRLVDCQVTRGKTIEGGPDYYREYAWAAVPEEEQAA
jgi:hypothetical protein